MNIPIPPALENEHWGTTQIEAFLRKHMRNAFENCIREAMCVAKGEGQPVRIYKACELFKRVLSGGVMMAIEKGRLVGDAPVIPKVRW